MTKPLDLEALRQEADKVRQRAIGKVVNVTEDSGVRGRMLTRAMAKAKRRRLNSLNHRGLAGLRQTREQADLPTSSRNQQAATF